MYWWWLRCGWYWVFMFDRIVNWPREIRSKVRWGWWKSNFQTSSRWSVERNSVTWKSCDRVPMFEKYFRFSRTPGLCVIFTVNTQVPLTMTCSAPIWTTSRIRRNRVFDVRMCWSTGNLVKMRILAIWAVRKCFFIRLRKLLDTQSLDDGTLGHDDDSLLSLRPLATSIPNNCYSQVVTLIFQWDSWQGRRVIGWTLSLEVQN